VQQVTIKHQFEHLSSVAVGTFLLRVPNANASVPVVVATMIALHVSRGMYRNNDFGAKAECR